MKKFVHSGYCPLGEFNPQKLFRIMKLTVLLLWVAMMGVHATGYSQKNRMDVKIRNGNLSALFNQIQQKTDYLIFYKDDLIKKASNRPINLDLHNVKVSTALDQALQSTDLDYKINGRQIAIIEREARRPLHDQLSAVKLLEPEISQILLQEVTGVVRDSKGAGLPGAAVTVKGTTKGATTDVNGAFKLSVEKSDILVFSFIGYLGKEEIVGDKTTFNIELKEDAAGLEEVVVVGFGTQRKITTIGAQSTVSVADLKQPVRNLTTVLAGRISGVISVQRSGEPGYDNASLWVRGVSTFTGTSPLVLVDGIQRDFANINPEDIESFSILKDASATAVYGVRGANGVILINTKKGKPGTPQINVGLSQGITSFTKLPKFVDGGTYMEMVNEAKTTRGNPASYSQDAINKTRSGEDPYLYPDVNWMDEIFNKTGKNTRVNFNITGGSENADYYISTSYFSETGLFKTDGLANYNSAIKTDRYNFTSNVNLNVTKTTKLSLGIQGYIMNGNFPGTGTNTIFGSAMQAPPVIYPVKYPDGKISGLQAGSSVQNPYDQLTQSGYVTEWRNQLFSNIRVTQDLGFWAKGLTFTSLFSFDAFNQHNISRTKTSDNWLATGRNSAGDLIYNQTRIGSEYLNYSRVNTGDRQFYTETSINYNRNWEKHGLGLMVLYNQTDKIPGFADDFILSLPFRNRGLAGRGTYSYADKYLMEFNFGYNGSENFEPSRRYGFFPSIGLGWVASEEKFFKPLTNAFQLLKFRFSHGQSGNSNIDPNNSRRFGFISTVNNNSSYTFGKAYDDKRDGLDIAEYAASVSWEVSTKTNLGLDIRALDNALYLQLDYFKEKRDGIFLRRSSLPAIFGLRNNPYGNLGITENHGIDGTLEYNKRIGKLDFGIRGTFTYAKNKVIEDDLPPWKYPWLERKGKKIGQRFGLVAEGLFETEEEIKSHATQVGSVLPGDVKYKDINGDGKIDAFDEMPIGFGAIPEIVYGFGLTLGYKNFSLAGFFQGIGNVDILLGGEGFVPFQQGGNRGNLLSEITDRWTPENPNQDAFYPRLTFGDENMNYRTSTRWVQNGRYLRLKSLELAYKFPQHWFKAIGVKNSRIYLLGYNVLTFSKFKMWDVELGDGRGAAYPNLTSFNAGIDFNF
ncbi:TonB-dependent receptor [Dyadobacter psychrotolerans]|uniref:SusC/RagA family TonB-linked outer membrane protein n=1 Tax=Dyadobacter psychrotolerans TaxID=2541721 RepID=A0A4R5DUW9_9BACT|nr:TonB-dependent receptor [Dyadobacter psychrotolerans]TDE18302.1 SusC/RagA family TonB-linked outer membrane protein [Dyadobacter psychrotolerans]